MNTYGLILNNEPGKVTRTPQGKITSIIDLIFTTPDIGALNMLVINNKLTTLSAHEFIVYQLADPGGEAKSMGNSQKVIRWGIRVITVDCRKESENDITLRL